MAIYLGNKKVSTKSGYVATGMKAYFDAGGKCAESNFKDLTNILKYDDTSNMTDMSSMFSRCIYLTKIPLIDTSNVTKMSDMFYDCRALTTIPQIDTSNATNMFRMFRGCEKLITIPQLNMSKAESLSFIFSGCTKLAIIPQLDVSNIIDFYEMFYECHSLSEIHMTGMKADFDISVSTKFTHDALVEILNNLATVTSTKTLTMGSTNLAKLTDEDKAIATNKGWTLA